MNTDVSIILICHNKYPQNLYVLYSLENQTYDPAKMEVILVDDNSTDQTISLKNFTAPYHYKYCRSTSSLGRAGAKNFGLKHTEGKIIIFLDGEVMVDADFVTGHLRHHSQSWDLAVSGNASHYNIFSFLHPGFSKRQIRALYYCLQGEPLFIERLAKRLDMPGELIRDFRKLWWYARRNKELVPLLTKEDIRGRQFKFTFPAPFFHSRVMKKYAHDLSGYHLAWTFFITRNASVSKNLLDAVGPFSEQFRGWGSEDWELGFRLYKHGVKFVDDRDIISYHQEHPYSMKRNLDKMYNYATYTTLHPEIEVCALCLGLLGKRGLLQINNLIEDCYQLKDKYSNEFDHVQDAFIQLTQQIPLLLAEGKPVTRLLQHVGLEKKPEKKQQLLLGLKTLRKTGEYSHYLSALDLLLGL